MNVLPFVQENVLVKLHEPMVKRRIEQSEAITLAELESIRELNAVQASQVKHELNAQKELKVLVAISTA
jgi:hypothetical protein